LSIGARSVIATLGTIYDEVANEVVRNFYHYLETMPPESALALTLREFARSEPGRLVSGTNIPLCHPAAWWPFVVISGSAKRGRLLEPSTDSSNAVHTRSL
jgi:CHAT domain-containing protein